MAFSSCRKAREDLEARTQKLSEVMANFGDVVPSKDYERLDAQFKVIGCSLSLFHLQFPLPRFRVIVADMPVCIFLKDLV